MKDNEKLKNSLFEFRNSLTKMNNIINEIKSNWSRNEVSQVARGCLNLKHIKAMVNNLNDFVVFPKEVRDPGRPIKFPDSKKEKELLKKFRNENLSLRSIAEETGMSKDMVDRKLKRYGIK